MDDNDTIIQSCLSSHKGKDLCPPSWNSPDSPVHGGVCFWLQGKEEDICKQRMVREKKRWCLIPYLASWTMVSGVRGKSTKGSVSAV